MEEEGVKKRGRSGRCDKDEDTMTIKKNSNKN